jgi:integrase
MLKKLFIIAINHAQTAGRVVRGLFMPIEKEASGNPNMAPDMLHVSIGCTLNAKQSGSAGAAPNTPAVTSLKNELLRLVSEINPSCTECTRRYYDRAAAFALKSLPEDVQAMPLDQVKPEHFDNLRQCLTNLSLKSREDLARVLKRLINMLVERGLPNNCADILERFHSRAEPQKVRRLLSTGELIGILRVLPRQPSGIQLLFWLAFSGGMRLGDAVSLRRTNVDLATGRVRYRVGKNHTMAEFFLVEKGLECLRKRRYAKNEPYIFPEFVRP